MRVQATSHYNAIALECGVVSNSTMTATESENLREILLQWSSDRKMSVNRWAKAAGIGESVLRNFLSGRSTTLTYSTLDALAEALDVSVSRLLSKRNTELELIPLNTEVAADRKAAAYAGKFGNRKTIALPEDRRFPEITRYAANILDDSADQYYSENDIVVYVHYEDLNIPAKVGDRVICIEAWDNDSLEYHSEPLRAVTRVSVREVVNDAEQVWLALRSRSPRWNQHIKAPASVLEEDQEQDAISFIHEDGHHVYIWGKIIGAYKLE
jgi:DNA-binding Xre family transcriptional regulator